MARKPISEAVKKKLFALSGNQCAFPKCTERVYNLEDEVLLGELCHINAVNPSGARYEFDLPEEEINSFENILLLCPNHHTIVDKNETKYNIAVLHAMKVDHEKKFYNNASKFEILLMEGEGVIEVERLEELEAIDASVKTKPKEEHPLPPKKDYLPTKDYITRFVTSVRDSNEFSFESKTLLETIEEENRLTVLGVAGSGKSVELAHAAYVNSQVESDLYPVKIRLNTLTNQPIEDLLLLEYPELNNIPHERLLILLDALDEVHSDYLDIAASNILLLGKKYEKAKIVVSCRNNFYITETDKRRAKLEGFSTYLIKPLEYYSVRTYLEGKIDVEPDTFIEDLRKKKFYDLLYSPFYLVNLVDYYNTKKEIPESKKIVFNYLIAQRIESDYEKYENAGVSIQDHTLKIEERIEQLAIIAESLGKNYLDERKEVLPLISDRRLLKVIKRTFLFNKSPQEQRWEFEHNNFQEFLAARFLTTLAFEEVQQFVSFAPDFKKIKPSWLNTLSFLFSLLEVGSDKYNKLVNWVRIIEPDILVRFEKDKISLQVREKLFKEIYEEYEAKQIIIRNEKFESEDLALFVSDSTAIIEYLIEKIVASDDKIVISEALRMLPYFNRIGEFTDKIRMVIANNLCRDDLSEEIKYFCLYALYDLKISDDKLTKEILEHNSLDSGQYIRAGFYKYLGASNQREDYIEIMLKGIELLKEPVVIIGGKSEQTKTRFGDEEYNLQSLLDKIKSPENVKRILDWSAAQEIHGHLENIIFKQIRKALVKAVVIYNDVAKELYDSVLNLLIALSRRYHRELGKDFQQFFKETHMELEAFQKLYKDWQKAGDNGFDLTYAMTLVCNEECVRFLIEEIKAGRFVDPDTWRFRNFLGWDGNRKIQDLYHQELLKIDEEKYAYIEVDYEVLRKTRRDRDIELLFAKDQFLKEAKEIFEEESEDKTRLTRDELFDWKRKRFDDDEMTNQIVVDTLRERGRDKKYVDLQEIEELVANESAWMWFTLHKLISYDQHNPDFKFNEQAIEFIHAWVMEEIKSANFKTAIEVTHDRGYHYRFAELYISYFAQRLNLELPEESFLDFLFVDCYLLPTKQPADNLNDDESKQPTTRDFLINKLGQEKVTDRILANLKGQVIVPMVRQSHFKYCQDYKINQAAPIVFANILEPGFDNFDQELLITQYTELTNDNAKLLGILDDLPPEVRLHATDQLAEKKYNPIKEYAISKIEAEQSEETQLRYIKIVAKIDESEAFPLLKEWILHNKRLPDQLIGLTGIGGAKLDDLIEVFEDSLDNNYGTGPWTSRNDYLMAMIALGSQNDVNYVIVRDKLNFWLGKYEGMKFLHYQIQKLEQQYYSKKSQVLTFDEALGLVSNQYNKSSGSILKRFWKSNKTLIEIILAIMGFVGFIITILSMLL